MDDTAKRIITIFNYCHDSTSDIEMNTENSFWNILEIPSTSETLLEAVGKD